MNKFIIATVFFVFYSCTTIRETHYFKDKIESGNDLNINATVSNYYKVHIRGWAFLSSSRYVSGYFDEDVVNEYFNEIKQPENGKLFQWLPTNSGGETKSIQDESSQPPPTPQDSTGTAGELEEEDSSPSVKSEMTQQIKKVPTEPGAELVLILSTNAEAIATQIKNTAVNKDVMQSLTLLANKDKIERASEIQSEMNDINTDIDLYIMKISSYIDALNTTEAKSQDKKVVFQLLKSELKDLGVTRNFDNYEDLKTWYYENN